MGSSLASLFFLPVEVTIFANWRHEGLLRTICTRSTELGQIVAENLVRSSIYGVGMVIA